MTSARRRRANRKNARRSRGAVSAAGKARAAKNARQHGLTAAPGLSEIADWYRVILNDPAAEPDPLTRDPVLRAALQLAEAEIRRAGAVAAQTAHLGHLAETADHPQSPSLTSSCVASQAGQPASTREWRRPF